MYTPRLLSFPFLPLFCIFTILTLLPLTTALVNVTIDDTYGDNNTGNQITYYPSDVWKQGPCDGCTAQPYQAQAFDGTWHDGTYFAWNDTNGKYPGTVLSLSVKFNGSAVYVYCILTRSDISPNGNSDMTFYIDDVQVGNFTQSPNGDKTYAYNQIVFSKSDLSQGEHNLTLKNGLAGSKALVLLDRIVYSTEDDEVTTTITPVATSTSSGSSTSLVQSSQAQTFTSRLSTSSRNAITATSASDLSPTATSSSSSSSSNSDSRVGMIAGVVIGSAAGLLLFALIWWVLAWRKRRAEEDRAGRAVQPFLDRAPPGGGVRAVRSAEDAAFEERGRNTFVSLPWLGMVMGAGSQGRGHGRSENGSPHSPDSYSWVLPTSPVTTSTALAARFNMAGVGTGGGWMGAGAAGPGGSGEGSGEGGGASPREYAAKNNVRSEKSRFFFTSSRPRTQAQHQHQQSSTSHRSGNTRQRPKVSPFSPTQLYTPTPGLNDVMSPTSAPGSGLERGTVSASGSGSASGSREPLTGRVKSRDHGRHRDRAGKREREGGLDTVSHDVLLHPNRRHDFTPSPLSEPNVRSLHHGRKEGGMGRGEEEDESSEVRWQRRIANVFTASPTRNKRRSLPRPPASPQSPSDPRLPPLAYGGGEAYHDPTRGDEREVRIPRVPGLDLPGVRAGMMTATATPPPAYEMPRFVEIGREYGYGSQWRP